jgi:hypothetical protein
MREIQIGKGGRRTITVTVAEDNGALAPLASLTASATVGGAPWSATGVLSDPATSAKLVLDGALTATLGRNVVTLVPTLADGDVEPQAVAVVVT